MTTAQLDVPGLVRDLGDEVAEVREAAVRTLLQSAEPSVEDRLLRVVAEPEAAVLLRRGAARVLHLLSLRRDLGHVRGYTREQAIRALSPLGSDARLVLWPALDAADPIVRTNARRALVAVLMAGPAPASR